MRFHQDNLDNHGVCGGGIKIVRSPLGAVNNLHDVGADGYFRNMLGIHRR